MDIAAFIAFIAALFSAALAFIVAWRSHGTAHRSFATGMFALAVESLFNGLVSVANLPEEQVFWEQCRLVTMSFLPGTWLFFSLTYSRGNYRDFLRRWRFVLIAAFLLPIVALLFQGRLISEINLAHGNRIFVLREVGVALNLLFLAGAVLVLMNLERTFRSAIGTMRWRIKFMIVGLGVLFAVRSYGATQALLFHAVDLSWQFLNGVALIAACGLISRSLFRTGHFDVDIYPSHSLLQNSLTAVLAGIYLFVIGIFANVVAFLGGDNSFAVKAFFVLIALVLLTVLLLSDRVRLWSARFVSRHFQRPQYDYRDLWRKFTESTTSCVSANELAQATVKFTANIFRALSVTIWLVDENGESLEFAASTSLSGPGNGDLSLDKDEALKLLTALKQNLMPFDIELSRETFAATLKKIHPAEFSHGAPRVCAPLAAVAGQLLGVIILGDRIGAIPFSGQDLDLLKCIADEIAASLLNVQLSKKLLQAKELEAFQTMSAFFVHDLKNAASTLNLMVKNLPVHFNDPAFREDALRGMSKSVAHINRLIERLTLLRHELKITPIEGDLNDWVSRSLAEFERNSGATLVKELKPLPKVFFDREQLLKVLTNLAINAKEASPADGMIRVATSEINGWAVLSVSDNGCGMDNDFLNRSLFRPFRTTKKNGLGIGMFQSKMIVEAHRGRIEVQSQSGKGTTFRVFLPVHYDYESQTAHH